LLLEAGWKTLCDRLVFIDAPLPTRLARALARGWSEEQFSARQGAQESLQIKRRLSDVVIDNSGSEEQTRAQLQRLWQSWAG